MSKILVLGYELPELAVGPVEARSYRTWQFVEPLLACGHQVCLIASHRENQLDVVQRVSPSLSYHRLNFMKLSWLKQSNAISDRFQPDAILSIMLNHGLRATRLSRKKPLWIDLYGDRVAEGQVYSKVRNSNRGQKILFEYLDIILRNADVYSTCSTPQKFEVVGHLGMARRLTSETIGYDFVQAILPGAPSKQMQIRDMINLRGEKLPDDAFIVLWCGGYNVWTDVEVLFRGLSAAMEKDSRIHYVSAGAGVAMQNNTSYERLLEMITNSPHKDRFHMLGWQPSTAIPGLYQQADIGINLDAFHYETMLGTRTRLVEMMHYGLPVVTTLGCELSHIIRDQELGLTFQIGDTQTFSQQILALAADKSLHNRLAQRARDYTRHELSFEHTTQPLLEWAKKPTFAPDRAKKSSAFDVHELESNLRAMVRSLLWRFLALERGE
jgi:glycosyltransferase involved in cell wall biosynthesis